MNFAIKEWKLSLDFKTTRAKYIADGSLDDSCSVAQLELRAILDSPMAINYLITNHTECSSLFLQLLGAWNDVQECMKYAKEERKKGIDGLFARHKNKAGCGLFDEHEEVYRARISGLLNHHEIELVDEKTLQAVRHWCFTQLFAEVYEPFRLTPAFEPMYRLLCRPDCWVSPHSFEYFDVIAEGGFGLVMLCAKKSTGTMYAMKIQPKRRLLYHFRNDKRRVMTEMQACSLCDHPYISKLAYGMQTSSLTMLVFPVAACGDLSRVLAHTATGCLPIRRVQFYAAEIVSALLYLHNLGFIHRDLKLENVLLNADGHVVLTDFGSLADLGGLLCSHHDTSISHTIFKCCSLDGGSQGDASRGSTCAPSIGYSSLCKDSTIASVRSGSLGGSQVTTNGLQRTKTLVGTIEYMAPEIICMFAGKTAHKDGYTAAVDWWSLGIMIYKMLVGKLPFKVVPSEVIERWLPELLSMHPNNSFEDVFTAVLGTINYSVPQLSPYSIDLLCRLLKFDADKRLGGGLWNEGVGMLSPDKCPIRSHSFFSGIDWAALERKQVVPPYIPVDEVATVSQADASIAGKGLTFTEALSHARRTDLIDTDDPCMMHSPPLRANCVIKFINTLRSFVCATRNVTSSRTSTNVDRTARLNISDSDQKYFCSWNYVSYNLFEDHKPFTATTIVSQLVSCVRFLINRKNAVCNSRIAPS